MADSLQIWVEGLTPLSVVGKRKRIQSELMVRDRFVTQVRAVAAVEAPVAIEIHGAAGPRGVETFLSFDGKLYAPLLGPNGEHLDAPLLERLALGTDDRYGRWRNPFQAYFWEHPAGHPPQHPVDKAPERSTALEEIREILADHTESAAVELQQRADRLLCVEARLWQEAPTPLIALCVDGGSVWAYRTDSRREDGIGTTQLFPIDAAEQIKDIVGSFEDPDHSCPYDVRVLNGDQGPSFDFQESFGANLFRGVAETLERDMPHLKHISTDTLEAIVRLRRAGESWETGATAALGEGVDALRRFLGTTVPGKPKVFPYYLTRAFASSLVRRWDRYLSPDRTMSDEDLASLSPSP